MVRTHGAPLRGAAFVVAVAALSALTACTTTSSPNSSPKSSGSSGSTGTSASVPRTSGPGVSASTITIATSLLAGAKTGSPSVKFVDEVAQSINSTGGVDGRKIVFAAEPKVTLNGNGDEAKICASYQQSTTKYFAQITSGATKATAQCLNAAGTVVVTDSAAPLPDDLLSSSPYVYAPATFTVTDANAATVAALKSRGALSGKRVALLTISDAEDEVQKTLAPELKAAGAVAADGFYYQAHASTTAASRLAAILKIKQGKYDIVLVPFPPNGQDDPLYEAPNFTAQKYRPMLSGALVNGADAKQSGLGANDAILRDALFLGWRGVMSGVPAQQAQNLANASPLGKRCLSQAQAAGVNLIYGDDPYLAFCDDVDFLVRALKASGSTAVNAQAVAAGTSKLTAPVAGASTFQICFPAGRHDGACALRAMQYSSSTRAFAYTGDNITTEAK
jgi:hypothetical protein